MGKPRNRRKMRDDRGREVDALTPAIAADMPKDSPQAQLVRRLACNDFTISGPRAVAAAVVLVISYFIVMGVLDHLTLPDWVDSAIGYGMFAAGVFVANYLFWTGASRQIAATAVRRGLCGSCGYSLEALPAEPDGCLLCPECGAAWRPGRMTRPHWKGTSFNEREETRSWWPPAAVHRLVEDDRGTFADVLDMRLKDAARPDVITREERELIRRDLRAYGRGSRIAVTVLLVVPLGLILLGAIASGELFYAFVGIGLVLFTGLGGWVIHRSFGYIPRRVFCRVMKRHGIMPCCGERLEGEVDEWGCVTCARCGAGWKAG